MRLTQMTSMLKREVEFLCRDLFDKGQNDVLIYGTQEHTLAALTGVYEKAKKREEFLCSWHDASVIYKPMDFFEPILRLKYGVGYEQIKKERWFKDLVRREEKSGVFQLARFCAQEEKSENPNARRLPVIFINGIEDLFFKMDYSHLTKEDQRKVLSEDLMEQPLPNGFGDCLRAHLHQAKRAIFYGTVRNTEEIEFMTTLGNYNYLFYNGNFKTHIAWEYSSPLVDAHP